jgi:hypothetical protein
VARSSAGAFVAGLTAAALAAVGLLAYQASAAQDKAAETAARKSSASLSPEPKASPRSAKKPSALPTDSGSGQRVVYALEAQRVWLVDESEKVLRTYEVTPSAVSPPPGRYSVTSRSAHITGSDGVPVENVVRFTQVDGAVVGFSAALDDQHKPTADPSKQTGGIRESREDGEAMWLFATIGTPVVVLP